MPRKASSKTKKSRRKKAASDAYTQDGRGVHWHCLIWLIVITVLFSTIAMFYAAWSFSTYLPEARIENSSHKLDQRMETIERRLNLVEQSLQRMQNMMEEDAMMRAEELEAIREAATSSEDQ